MATTMPMILLVLLDSTDILTHFSTIAIQLLYIALGM
jgi:hypothetical protein